MGKSPTQRTLDELKKNGCMAGVVERFIKIANSPHGVRKDFLGFIDIIAVEPGKIGCLGIQACAGSGFAEHVRKIKEECWENAEEWLRAENRIEVWGWRKVKLKRGSKAMRWKPKVEVITNGEAGSLQAD